MTETTFSLDEQLAIALAQYGDAVLTIEQCEKIIQEKKAEIAALREERVRAESLKQKLAQVDAKLSEELALVSEGSQSV